MAAAPYVSLYSNKFPAARLATGSVTTAKILDGTIAAADIASNAVTAAKIITDAVTADKILASAVTTAKIAANAVTPAKIEAVAAAAVESGLIVLHKSFAAGAPGSAGDITLFAAASVPRKLRILDVQVKVITGIADKTATLRTAAAGAGSALSSAMSTATTGTTVRDAGTASATITTTDGLFLRLTDIGNAGEVTVICRPET